MAIKTLGKEYRNESEAIQALQGELAKLEKQREAREAEVLKNLPKEVGLSSVDELIHSLAEYAGTATRKRVLRGAAKKKRAATRKKKTATRKKKTATRKKKTTARKSAAKKSAGRKKVAKKAASKKRASKKTATKKSARKKVAKKKSAAKKSTAGKTAAKKRRSRAQINEQTIAKMKDAFASKMTGPEIAKQFGVSQSSVHNIKKRLGMVKS